MSVIPSRRGAIQPDPDDGRQGERNTLPELHGRARNKLTPNGDSYRIATIENPEQETSKPKLREEMRSTLQQAIPHLADRMKEAPFKDVVRFAEILARYGVGQPEESTANKGDVVQQVVILPELNKGGG